MPSRHEASDTGTLGALIRAERRAQGLRQPDLAAAAGTSVRFVVEVERGKPTAQIGKVLELLRQLGLRLSVEGLSAEGPGTPWSDGTPRSDGTPPAAGAPESNHGA